MLSIGQVLKIPVEEDEESIENVYIVKKGDSLYKIAQNFETTVSDIMKLNNLTNTNLSIGQRLQIPIIGGTSDTYIVEKGDSLYKIAQKYNTTIDELIKLNNLTSTNLSIGQKLKVPITGSTSNIYIVQGGDSLYKIAQKYNTTVDALMKLNNLSTTLLSVGQKLKLR